MQDMQFTFRKQLVSYQIADVLISADVLVIGGCVDYRRMSSYRFRTYGAKNLFSFVATDIWPLTGPEIFPRFFFCFT